VTDLPPLKESRPEIPGLTIEEIWELAPKIILPFLGGFLLGMVTPLHLEKLDLSFTSDPHGLFQDSEWFLAVG
jgi:hypothetical protein